MHKRLIVVTQMLNGYDDLLSNYNKLVRPVANVTETVTVHLKLKLSQLIAVVSIFSPYNYIKGYINYQ